MTCILKVFSGPFVQVSQMIFPGPIFVQVSRIIFPMGFAVFNISYWVYYLHIIAVSHQSDKYSPAYISTPYILSLNVSDQNLQTIDLQILEQVQKCTQSHVTTFLIALKHLKSQIYLFFHCFAPHFLYGQIHNLLTFSGKSN